MGITQPTVSVIMPVRNEFDYINQSIGSILNQDYPQEKIEIIVADGMSTDGTRAVLHEYQANFKNIQYINNTEQIVPTGLNYAISQSTGEIIVRIDGHCKIPTDYLKNCVYHLSSNEVSGVGGSIKTIGVTTTAAAIACAMSSKFGVGDSAFRTTQGETIFVDTIPFPAYKRRTILKTGTFDEELIRNQDDEYNYRIRAQGGKILLASDIKAEYYSRGSLSSLWKQFFQYGHWKVRVLQKHPRQMQARQFMPPLFVAALLLTALTALIFAPGLWLFFIVAGSYILVNLVFSLITAARTEWLNIILLPFVYSCMHLSYGSGFLTGLLRFTNRWGDRQGKTPTWIDVEARLQRDA